MFTIYYAGNPTVMNWVPFEASNVYKLKFKGFLFYLLIFIYFVYKMKIPRLNFTQVHQGFFHHYLLQKEQFVFVPKKSILLKN